MSAGARVRAYVKRAALGVLVVVVAVVALVAWLTQSESGRARLLAIALGQANAVLPGRVQARELVRLDLSGVELRGLRVVDPGGAEVATLSRLAVSFDARALLSGRGVVHAVTVEQGKVDLRELGPTRGLVAAFVDPKAPPAPPSAAPAPFVRVEQIELTGLDVRAPELPELGQVDVLGLGLSASFELDGEPSATVSGLHARLARDGQPLGQVRQLSLTLAPGRELSAAELELELAGITLSLHTELLSPAQAEWRRAPLRGELEVSGVTAERLATLLRRRALSDAFDGAAGLQAALLGSAEELWLRANVSTAAGELAFRAALVELKRLTLGAWARELRASALRAGLPSELVTFELWASADASREGVTPIVVELSGARAGEAELPELRLAAVVSPGSARGLTLGLRDGPSQLGAEGFVDFAGSGKLRLSATILPETLAKWQRLSRRPVAARGSLEADLNVELDAERRLKAKGSVDARQLAFGDAFARRASVKLDVSGELLRPRGSASLLLEDARLGASAVPRLALTIVGGPSDYALQLRSALAVGNADADLRLSREAEHVSLSGTARGSSHGKPWQLEVSPTRIAKTGHVQTEGIELRAAGQSAKLSGRASPGSAEVELTTGALDLEPLGQLMGLEQQLKGKLQLTARLTGDLTLPRLDLALSGASLSVAERPPVDLSLQLELDARAGELKLQGTLSSALLAGAEPALRLGLLAAHRFHGGRAWASQLLAGELDAKLNLTRLHSSFVAAWLESTTFPAQGRLSGEAHVTGTFADPRLALRLDAEADVRGARLDVATRLTYRAGVARLALTTTDAGGAWLTLEGALEVSQRPLDVAQLSARLPRALSDESWRLHLRAEERELTRLPGLTSELPVAVAAQLSVTHQPRAEPELVLEASARPTRLPEAFSGARCSVGQPRAQLRAQLAAAELRASLVVLDGGRQLAEAKLSGPLGLAKALAGEAPELGELRASVQAARLELASLPLVCGLARGTVDANITLSDPLGARPRLDAALSASGLSLGAPQQVDVELRAAVARDSASVDVELVADRAVSKLHVELPVTLERGRVALARSAPIRADLSLRGLPLAPLLPSAGPISYASGSIDGDARVRGTLDAPQLQGRLELNDIAFTATDVAQPLRDVRGRIEFTHDKLLLKGFEAHDRSGVLLLDGQLRFQDSRHLELQLDVETKEFPLRQQGQVVATADVRAKVRTVVRPERTDVAIELGAVDVWIESTEIRRGVELAQHPDFVVDGAAPPLDASTEVESVSVEARKRAPRVTMLELTTGDKVWIKRGDFAVKLHANLTTRIAGDDALVKGRVALTRGYLDLMGKTFELERDSYLDFIGSAAPDPALSIKATHQNRRSGSTVTVSITGRSSAPVLTFSVDEQTVSVGEAFGAIYGSQQSNRDPKEANGQARAFVGGLTAGLLATTARRELGAAAPIIMVEPGEQSGQGRIRAGFEFDSLVPSFLRRFVTGVYFEGIVANESSGDANLQKSDARVQAGFLLELYFPYNFFSAGQRGPGSTWSLDVGWQL